MDEEEEEGGIKGGRERRREKLKQFLGRFALETYTTQDFSGRAVVS